MSNKTSEIMVKMSEDKDVLDLTHQIFVKKLWRYKIMSIV